MIEGLYLPSYSHVSSSLSSNHANTTLPFAALSYARVSLTSLLPNIAVHPQPYCASPHVYCILNITIGQPAAEAARVPTMSAARRQNTTPIIVEVRPNNFKGPSSLSPATPPSPKAVRFASAEPVSGVSRPLNPTEAWSLYHFETHARQCQDCIDPYSVYLNGRRLCPTGHALAQDVAIHVCHREGEVYSTKKDSHKYVRVEIPYGYDQVRGLLRSLDSGVRRSERTVPIISYDRTYPVSPRRREPEPEPEERAEAIVEPAQTPRRRETTRYRYDVKPPSSTVDEDTQASRARRRETEERSKRGSLYEKDMQRPRKEYRVEVREPADAEARRRRREREAPREEKKRDDRDRDREKRRRRKEERR